MVKEIRAVKIYRYHLDDKGETITCISDNKEAEVYVKQDLMHVDLGYNIQMHKWRLSNQNMYEYCYTIALYENECVDEYLAEIRNQCYQCIMRNRQILERMISCINTGVVKEY